MPKNMSNYIVCAKICSSKKPSTGRFFNTRLRIPPYFFMAEAVYIALSKNIISFVALCKSSVGSSALLAKNRPQDGFFNARLRIPPYYL